MTDQDDLAETLVALTADIVSAQLSNNRVSADEIPALIRAVHQAMTGLGEPAVPAPAPLPDPAVPVRQSVRPDYIVCLEDGKKLKMLKRYLMTRHGMTPDQYRRRWSLPADYPMVAPNYAERRRSLAKEIGLGTRNRDA